jgi:hypothetical protein
MLMRSRIVIGCRHEFDGITVKSRQKRGSGNSALSKLGRLTSFNIQLIGELLRLGIVIGSQ